MLSVKINTDCMRNSWMFGLSLMLNALFACLDKITYYDSFCVCLCVVVVSLALVNPHKPTRKETCGNGCLLDGWYAYLHFFGI